MPFSTPNIFVGGTIAQAVEVNENFEAVREELNKHSQGIVEAKTLANDTKSFVEGELRDDLFDIVRSQKPKFCVNFGPLGSLNTPQALKSEGQMSLVLSASEEEPVVYTTVQGEVRKQTQDLTLDTSELPNGTHNIAINDDALEAVKNIFAKTNKPTGELLSSVPVMTSNTSPEGAVTYTGTLYTGVQQWHLWGALSSFSWSSQSGSNTYTYPVSSRPKAGRKAKVSFSVDTDTGGRSLNNITVTLTHVDDTTNVFTFNNAAPVANAAPLNYETPVFVLEKDVKSITFSHSGSSVNLITARFSNARLFVEEDLTGTIWLDTSTEPLKAFKFDGDTWEAYEGVPVGNVTVSNGAITKTSTFPYNQNGYSVNVQTKDWARSYPDYSKGISKAWNTTHTATQNGFIVAYFNPLLNLVLSVNGVIIGGSTRSFAHDNGSVECSAIFPISTGDTYKLSGGGTAAGIPALTFYPAKGEN